MIARPVPNVNVVHIMALIAATAIGLTAIRYYVQTPWGLRPSWDRHGAVSLTPLARPITRVECATMGSLLLAAWSFVLFGMGLRVSRSNPRAMVAAPGRLASMVAALVVIGVLGYHLRHGWPVFEVWARSKDSQGALHQPGAGRLEIGTLDLLPNALDKLKSTVGPAIAAAWLILAVVRRWRAPADRIDRFGLAVGAGWILGLAASIR